MKAWGLLKFCQVSAWKDDHLEVAGPFWFGLVLCYRHKPYVKEHHHLALPLKKLVCSWELVVTNCFCRMMGELERDGFCEADQVLYPDVVQIPPTPETSVLY